MSTITAVNIWNDPGFTENCLEVPKKGATLPSPSLVIGGPINPSKGRMFTSIQVKEDYVTLMNATYLAVAVEMNNSDGQIMVFYGWVDSVVLESDTSGYPMTTINWHIDYWRTYIAKAVFGSGMVRRRTLKATDAVPPQSYPYRFMTLSDSHNLYGSGDVWWIIFFYVTSGETSYARWGAFPVDVNNDVTTLYVGLDGPKPVPSMRDVVTGQMEEVLGLNPDSIVSCFLSPIAPGIVVGDGSVNQPFFINNWYGTPAGGEEYFLYSGSDDSFSAQFSYTLPAPITTDDINTYVVTGFNGETIGALPWGIRVDSYTARIIASSTSMAIEVRFFDSTVTAQPDPLKAQSEGVTFDIALRTVDVTSNSWSSYVYSGSRQADMDTLRLQAEKEAVSGGISTGTSAVTGALSGAMMGAMAGAVGGPVGMLAGALIGGVGSALGGAISTGANYAYNTGRYADEMQSINDYRASHQANSLNVVGGGYDCINNGVHGINLITMTKDDYSVTQRDSDIMLYGVNVSEPMESCQALVDAGGPLQITNLTVTGDMPVEAKQFFRTRFSKGVRMIGDADVS